MARRRRRRSRSRGRKGGGLLKKLGIGLLLLLPIGYFVFTQVFFDPFEEAMPAFPTLVPSNVDVYVRRERLDTDFGTFPAFAEIERVTKTREFGEMAATAWWQGLEWPAALEAAVAEIREATSGQDLVDPGELLGRELVLVGRLPAPTPPAADGSGGADFAGGTYAALLRLTPTGKLGYEAFVEAHDRIVPGSQLEDVKDPDLPSLTYGRLSLPDQPPLYHARRSDLLVLSQDEQLLKDVLKTAGSGRERSLGLSRLYTETMPAGPADPAAGFDAEVMIDLQRLLAPPAAAAEASEDAIADILPRVIDPTLGEELVGRVAFDSGGVFLRGRTSLKSNRTAVERHGLLGTLPFQATERLSAKLGLLPRDVGAMVSLNADLSDLLKTIRDGLDPELATIIDRALRGMAQYNPQLKLNGLEDLIFYLDRVLGKDLTIALRPPDHEVPEGSQPMPALAIIADLRDPDAWDALGDAVIRGHRAFGIPSDGMFKQPEGGVGERKWLEVPGTSIEAVSWIVLDARSDGGTLVLGTDDDFVREIVAVYTGSRGSLASDPAVRELVDELEGERANLVAWVSAEGLADMVLPYGPWLAAAETAVDLASVRQAKRSAQLRLPEWRNKLGSDGELSAEDEAALDELLDDLVRESERERKAQVLPDWVRAWEERFSWLGLMEDAVFSIRMGERDAAVALRARTSIGR